MRQRVQSRFLSNNQVESGNPWMDLNVEGSGLADLRAMIPKRQPWMQELGPQRVNRK